MLTYLLPNSQAEIITNLTYWLETAQKKKVGFAVYNPKDKRHYIKRSYDKWLEVTSNIGSHRSLSRHLAILKKEGVLLIYRLNSWTGDQTNYYSINFDKLEEYLYSRFKYLLQNQGVKFFLSKGFDFSVISKKTQWVEALVYQLNIELKLEKGFEFLKSFFKYANHLKKILISEIKLILCRAIASYEANFFPHKVTIGLKSAIGYQEYLKSISKEAMILGIVEKEIKSEIIEKTKGNSSSLDRELPIIVEKLDNSLKPNENSSVIEKEKDNLSISEINRDSEKIEGKIKEKPEMELDSKNQPELLVKENNRIRKYDPYFDNKINNSPQNRGILGKLPEGPWKIGKKIDQKFIEYIAKKWTNNRNSKFYGQNIEDVKRCVLGSYINEPLRVVADWELYHQHYKKSIQAIVSRHRSGDRIAVGEIEELKVNQRAFIPTPSELLGTDEDLENDSMEECIVLLSELQQQGVLSGNSRYKELKEKNLALPIEKSQKQLPTTSLKAMKKALEKKLGINQKIEEETENKERKPQFHITYFPPAQNMKPQELKDLFFQSGIDQKSYIALCHERKKSPPFTFNQMSQTEIDSKIWADISPSFHNAFCYHPDELVKDKIHYSDLTYLNQMLKDENTRTNSEIIHFIDQEYESDLDYIVYFNSDKTEVTSIDLCVF